MTPALARFGRALSHKRIYALAPYDWQSNRHSCGLARFEALRDAGKAL